MLAEPKCYTRNCRHFGGHELRPVKELDIPISEDRNPVGLADTGVVELPTPEELEINVCAAFPDGIPAEIAYDEDLHLEIVEGQVGTYTYESVV